MYGNPIRLESRRQSTAGAWILRTLLVLLILAAIVVGAAWYLAGKAAGPRITIVSPAHAVGPAGELDVLIESPDARLQRLDAVLEQNGEAASLFTLAGAQRDALRSDGQGRLRLILPIGKHTLPQLKEGRAELSVSAARPVLYGYRHAESTARHAFDVRLTPPRLSPLSTLHHISPGGSEAVVYEVSLNAVASGVRVGELEYAGFPASGAGVAHADKGLRVAFFALAWNDSQTTSFQLFARDDVGNEARAELGVRVIPRSFRRGRIELDDRFLRKVVPAILEQSPELKVEGASNLLDTFLRINGELREKNGQTIAAFARDTAPEILWQGAFRQLSSSAVQGSFADQRTYFYGGREVDRQVHLGYDLASTAMAPVVAANRGKVVHAGALGIYGNCVILDHGMGLQSLYAHLSSVEVTAGSMVDEGESIGRTGSTGLAGGDHLHFTTLVGGTPVTPLEWWSPKWIQDRVTRKLREAEALGTGQRGSTLKSH